MKFSQEQVDDTIIPKMEVGKELVKRTKNLNENIESIMGSKFDDFKKRLSEIVNEDYIESWLQKPNASFNNRKPIDLINEDNYGPLYSMIYRLGSGEPSS
jgi:uncharacterized protein (DUF2384 family)